MDKVAVLKKHFSANFNGFFKLDVNKKWINISVSYEVAGVLTSGAKIHESFSVYLLLVNRSNIGTKYFASLCVVDV